MEWCGQGNKRKGQTKGNECDECSRTNRLHILHEVYEKGRSLIVRIFFSSWHRNHSITSVQMENTSEKTDSNSNNKHTKRATTTTTKEWRNKKYSEAMDIRKTVCATTSSSSSAAQINWLAISPSLADFSFIMLYMHNNKHLLVCVREYARVVMVHAGVCFYGVVVHDSKW